MLSLLVYRGKVKRRGAGSVRGRTGREKPSGLRPPGFYEPVYPVWSVGATENPGASFSGEILLPRAGTRPGAPLSGGILLACGANRPTLWSRPFVNPLLRAPSQSALRAASSPGGRAKVGLLLGRLILDCHLTVERCVIRGGLSKGALSRLPARSVARRAPPGRSDPLWNYTILLSPPPMPAGYPLLHGECMGGGERAPVALCREPVSAPASVGPGRAPPGRRTRAGRRDQGVGST